MMKMNVWKRILPALAAAAVVSGSNALAQLSNALDIPVQDSGSLAFDGSGTPMLPSGLDATVDELNFNGSPSTITGNGVAAVDGSAFIFRNIGDTTNLTALKSINFKNITVTGGYRAGNSGAGDFGGGAYLNGFVGGQTVTFTDSAAIGNIVEGTDAGTGGTGGGGLNLNNNWGETGVHAVLDGAIITGNTSKSGVGGAWGGGLSLTSFATIVIDGGTIANNRVEVANVAAQGVGGGISIFNPYDNGANNNTGTIINITGTTVSNNYAKSAEASAVGGGLWLEGSGSRTGTFDVTLTNVTFTDNTVEGKTGAAGGAIYSDNSDIKVVADSGDVLLSGNKAIVDGVETKSSIYSGAKVIFDAKLDSTITDNDAIYAAGGFDAQTTGNNAAIKINILETTDYTANVSGTDSKIEIANLIAATAIFGGIGNTVENGNVTGTATINASSALNTTGVFTADTITAGGADALLNVLSGTTTAKLSNGGDDLSVDVATGAKLNVVGTSNTVYDLSGDGSITFTGIDYTNIGSDLLEVTNDKTFTGSVNVVDTLGVGVQYDDTAQKYSAVRSTVADIADGYLAIASIHNFNVGYQAVQDHLISGRARRLGFLGQSECDPCEPACDPCDPCGVLVGSGTRSAWVNYVGRNNQYRSNTLGADWDISSNGVQTGVDLYRTYKNQLGVLFGYEKSDSNLYANSIDADDVYFGFYAAHVFRNGADARIVANFGWQNYDAIRTDILNTNNRYGASFDGHTTELNLELGKRFYRSSSFSFRPVAAIDLYINDVEGAEEAVVSGTGVNAVKYNGLSYTQAFLRIGSDFKVERKRATLNGGIYYAYDMNDNKLKSTVTNGTVGTLNLYGSDLGRQVVTFNVGGSFAVTKKFDVFGGFTGNAYVDRDGTPFQSTGYVGGAVRW